MRLSSLLLLLLALARPADAADLAFGYSPNVDAGQKPWFTLVPPKAVTEMQVTIEGGGKSWKIVKTNLPAGREVKFEWPRDPTITEVVARVLVTYADHYEEDFSIPISYSYSGALSVDLSKASADLSARTLYVDVSAAVDSADVVAYGAHKVVVDQSKVPLTGGPGRVAIPWVGAPSDVVLLEVTVHSGGAWAGFTYSPWFLDIPHDDVLFESDQSVIRPSEEPKLQAVLAELRDVIDKYGAIVPVKLFVGGCTDTVGDSGHNEALSLARARAIAGWLRGHGFDKPLYYHGFGERWLAVPTADGVDEGRNRRAVYMVTSNPPSSGSGVPPVSWTPL